ncbi:amidohydrolase family protein [Paraburkholderia bannensis]|uniref:amidohydrolase family protein n=1 Tax=Paraburkholderia bannensis TaxID=765414 RepID=UPI002AB0846F|nr:amidohydrolase family protein [Paraburkholderia bannensis]
MRPQATMIVDSHAHVSPCWYEPVETLLHHMDRHGVETAVLTQMIGQVDNGYQQDCVSRYGERFLSVVWVDAQAPEAGATVERLAYAGAAGVRLRPGACLPDGTLPDVWRAAQQCGLPVSCVGSAEAFAAPAFAGLLAALPEITVVLEHLGGSSAPVDTDEALALRQAVFSLARLPNVMLKLPGMGELMPRSPTALRDGEPFGGRSHPLVEQALVAFGARRLMWGSDFPVVSAREGYGNALKFAMQSLAGQPAQALDDIFCRNALRVFRER